ncbi:hypothetical protein, partial [Microcystis sp.]|uniref:hypothetical protein n=1 Tax=Microcystis sp. TaxID=1127 RepID=UPI0039188D82
MTKSLKVLPNKGFRFIQQTLNKKVDLSCPMVEQLKPQYSVVWIDKMSEIPQQKWDALAQPLTTPF